MADLLSAISVFLVFLTFLFNGIEKEANEKIASRRPGATATEGLGKFNREIRQLLWLKVVPVSFVFGITFYCLLPEAVKIIQNSKFSLWDFNPLNTLFVFIETGLLGLTVFAFYTAYKLLKK